MSKKINDSFSFNLSLSVLNHLGRNLYRSFITVLGEAVSNSWDADAENVWIYIDKGNNSFIIKDDGLGMSKDDFQKKFLKVGYSKRGNDNKSTKSVGGRPYIGRKGIGKLALLSCAEKISVISKTFKSEYTGGCIDNSKLDNAISEDSTNYDLDKTELGIFEPYIKDHDKGTVIYFENIHEGIKKSLDNLKKIIALYFRFSLIDNSFNIFLNDDKITVSELDKFAQNTEFLWNINTLADPYVSEGLKNLKEENLLLSSKTNAQGFIASVIKPRYLKVVTTEEKVGIDLFVNGRLRETNILRHMPGYSTRHIASYLYGQIHFNDLDRQDVDSFTTSRDGIKEGDLEYIKLLKVLKEILADIANEWDDWRLKHKEEGDSENIERMSSKERKAKTLVEEFSKEFSPPKTSKNKGKIDGWINELMDDARFNVSSYLDCFMAENLIRKYIQDQEIPLTPEAEEQIIKWRETEIDNKGKGNISIEIMEYNEDVNYLTMDGLASLFDKKGKDKIKDACLPRDASEYKPMRNAVAHTARLTQVAKEKLTSVYENIKGRLKTLLFSDDAEKTE